MDRSFYDLNFENLRSELFQAGLNIAGASRLFNWHYKKKQISPLVDDLAKDTQDFLKERFTFNLPKIVELEEASDKTVKFLFELEDGQKVETVLIPFHRKYSICLSSQVGCAMKCSFCHTGLQGFKRNLKASEIVGQLLGAWKWLENNRPEDGRILNIVFMGQGEPLHNFDAVKNACDIFLSQNGASFAAQRITISTSGYLPGLQRWVEEMPGVNLALSLHSPIAQKRNELIPLNRAYPLPKVLEAIDKIPLAKKQFVTYEYLLIEDFNDSLEDAKKVGELLQGKRAYLNLIPFNPVPGLNYKRPSINKVEAFKKVLDSYKVPTLLRTTKGDEVMAACGQLNSSN